MTIRATVLQSGPASRPDDGADFIKVATDRDGENAFYLDKDAEYPRSGAIVTVDGRHVMWQREDGSMASATRRGFWFDDRGRWMG